MRTVLSVVLSPSIDDLAVLPCQKCEPLQARDYLYNDKTINQKHSTKQQLLSLVP